jgi:predicted nucleotide-binding protein
LPKERAPQAFDILKENGAFVGVVHETKTGPFVAVDDPTPKANAQEPAVTSENPSNNDGEIPQTSVLRRHAPPASGAPKPGGPKQLFVAHGKNHKPLEDLKKILNEFKIPYKVAIDEPNKGRPISGKVAELMNECSAGIFIFTKDEKFFREAKDGEHQEVWRPNENVVYELGAANILWERKIIIVREEGVNFPSDFSDLGYITFKDGQVASKALERRTLS